MSTKEMMDSAGLLFFLSLIRSSSPLEMGTNSKGAGNRSSICAVTVVAYNSN